MMLYEVSQRNRDSDIRSFMCSVFRRAIFIDQMDFIGKDKPRNGRDKGIAQNQLVYDSLVLETGFLLVRCVAVYFEVDFEHFTVNQSKYAPYFDRNESERCDDYLQLRQTPTCRTVFSVNLQAEGNKPKVTGLFYNNHRQPSQNV